MFSKLLKLRLTKILLISVIVFFTNDLLGQEENVKDTIQKKQFQLVPTLKPTPKTTINIGGAIRLRGVGIPYQQEENASKKGFYFDQFILDVDGDYSVDDKTKLIFSSQIRFFYYQMFLHHMWVGVEFNENHNIKLGVTQVPFGAIPTNSFWYSLGYYVGVEDDHDSGIKYNFNKNGWDFYLAYFRNAEYNDATATNRFAPDLTRSGDQQNEEREQGNIKLAKVFKSGSSNSTEIGFSGEIGGIENRTTGDTGLRWKAAFHYVGNYGKWSPKFQLARYVYEPNNPDGVDENLVQMSFFSDTRLVAAKANILNASIKRDIDIDWWLFDDLNIYFDYSKVYKDEASFTDSELINPGFVISAGPLYIWVDSMWGKNAWWFNDSSDASGPGAGAKNPDKYEFRQNVAIQWRF